VVVRVVFVENYMMESREALEDYFNKYAAPIRADHTRMWDGKFAASRRILTVFGKQDEQVRWCGAGSHTGSEGPWVRPRLTRLPMDRSYGNIRA
jgi:hypothetical protein